MLRKTILVGVVVILAIPTLALAYWLISPLFRDEEVNESFAFAIATEIPATLQTPPASSTSEEVAPTLPATEAVAVLLWQGNFTDQDTVHKGSGDALIYRLPDGAHVLRLENFQVTNGPDLQVLLSRDGTPGNALDLGKLKGNIGNQNYDIPADVDINAFQSVIIYCEPFSVVFSTAQLHPPSP